MDDKGNGLDDQKLIEDIEDPQSDITNRAEKQWKAAWYEIGIGILGTIGSTYLLTCEIYRIGDTNNNDLNNGTITPKVIAESKDGDIAGIVAAGVSVIGSVFSIGHGIWSLGNAKGIEASTNKIK